MENNILEFINNIPEHDLPSIFVTLAFISIITNVEEINYTSKLEPDISQLEYDNFSESIKQQNNICSICRDDYKKENIVSLLECAHIYHTNCIIKWCDKKFTCPLCRHPIKCKIK
jgi:hypothetical protein